jgi:membrane protein involved in colicin uptake
MRPNPHKIAIAAVVVLAVVALAAVAVVRPGADDQAAAEGGNPAGPEFQLEPGLSQAIAQQVLFDAVEAQQIRAYVTAVEAQQVTDYLRAVEAEAEAQARAAAEAEARAAEARQAAEREAKAAAAASSAPAVANGGVWDRLARCESGGNWSMNSGNGFYGGIQFMHSTWVSMGGRQFAEYPHQASREGQIAVAERLLAASGWGQWPACSAKLGLR